MPIGFVVKDSRVLLVYQPSGFWDEIMRRLCIRLVVGEDRIGSLELIPDEELGSLAFEEKYICPKKVFCLYRDELVLELSDALGRG